MFDEDHQHPDSAPRGIVFAQAARPEEEAEVWLVHRGRALPLRDWAAQWPCARFASVSDLIQQWSEHRADLQRLTELPRTAQAIAESGLPVGSLRLEAPLRPAQLFCTIGNYRRQVVEAAVDAGPAAEADRLRTATMQALDQRRLHGAPYICLTSADRVAAPVGELPLDPELDTLDWEVEIGAIIGAPGSRLPLSEAPAVIAGYSVVNDLTIRSRVARPDLPALGTDWVQCKGLQGSLPLGPWFVPSWQVPNPSGLRLRLSLNDMLMQDDTAEDMVFTIPEQLHYLSQHTRLRPGDVLCTGSPAGFGLHHGRFLRTGDFVKASVTGLGEQVIHCVDPEPDPNTFNPTPAAAGRTMTKEHV
ncbi:fumarylacetoacetate hydrolase family protein [Paenarthrobacter sp. NPDC089322]|uniref:fumarylacetoacetate hydrolase family protein n=1 Tax=Paenarthrobacter sp. NPDC089322 TaxID=3155065 RepID=UPI00341B1801